MFLTEYNANINNKDKTIAIGQDGKGVLHEYAGLQYVLKKINGTIKDMLQIITFLFIILVWLRLSILNSLWSGAFGASRLINNCGCFFRFGGKFSLIKRTKVLCWRFLFMLRSLSLTYFTVHLCDRNLKDKLFALADGINMKV